jgi:hypothetical protein
LGEREKAARERGERLVQQEKGLEVREGALSAREREVVHMRVQLEGVLATFEAASRDNQVGFCR